MITKSFNNDHVYKPNIYFMCRYRIQQAVRRLYDGYLHDHRLDNGCSGSSGSGSGSTGSGVSSGCSVGGSGRNRTALLESSLEHDSHNDSGYSTRMCTASQGPSPALSGASGALDSDSRSGQSTSSPNTTVISYPQHNNNRSVRETAQATSPTVGTCNTYNSTRQSNVHYATPNNYAVHGNSEENIHGTTSVSENTFGKSFNNNSSSSITQNNYAQQNSNCITTNDNYSKQSIGTNYVNQQSSSRLNYNAMNASQYVLQNNSSIYNGSQSNLPQYSHHTDSKYNSGVAQTSYNYTTGHHHPQNVATNLGSHYTINSTSTSSLYNQSAGTSQLPYQQQYYVDGRRGDHPPRPPPLGSRAPYAPADGSHPNNRPPVLDILTIGESSLV